MALYLAVTVVASALIIQSSRSADREPLSLSVRPRVCLSPCAILAKARIEPHENNRWLTLVADAPHFRRSSTVHLEGEHAARTHSMMFKNLRDGPSRVQVRLERTGGRSLLREHVVEVKGER